MPWTEITRLDHDRSDLRYASDCRDEEWKLIAPIVTQCCKVGRPRTVDMRRAWEAIQYIATTGCQWRQLPKDFPPVSTVRYHFYRMRNDGTWALSSNGTENTHKLAYRSSIPAVRGSRSGLSSPRAMISGSVKA